VPFEAAEHGQIAHVAAVKNMDRAEGVKARVEIGVRATVGV
jgi:hypothetical protein